MLTNRQLFLRHLGQTSGSPLMLEIESAEGVFLYGPSGEKYLDLVSGVSVSNTGHRHPRVVEAIKEQSDKYLHLMVYGEVIQSPQVKYAELLTSLLPGDLKSCYFVNSGSEAVEGALKLAKRFTGRTKIVSFRKSYHGSTHGALSVQGEERFKTSFRPLLPDVFIADFNCSDLSIIDDRTACVIVEPVQAEAGVILPEGDFLSRLQKRCEMTGALLVFDEAQTGFGRLGSMFAALRYSVKPDILVLAKAIGGGLPLGAFISSPKIMQVLTFNPPLGHITTFGGHPLSCAAGCASLKVILEEKLADEARRKSSLFRKYIKHPSVKEIRGEGLLLAVDLGNSEKTTFAVANAPSFGLLLDYFLFRNDSFRIAPPLTINDDEIRYACGKIDLLLDKATENVK